MNLNIEHILNAIELKYGREESSKAIDESLREYKSSIKEGMTELIGSYILDYLEVYKDKLRRRN